MDVAFVGSLIVLALVDSTSFGTLLIPIWLLLRPGPVRSARMLVFLGTVAGFYFVVGVGLALGADVLLPRLRSLLEVEAASWAQLGLGVALLVLSFRLGRRHRVPRAGVGRLDRWRQRALGVGGEAGTGPPGRGLAGLMGLALTAAVVEVTTMLPYLAAIGLITTAEVGVPDLVLIMAGYCLVMVTPALVLLVIRLAAGSSVDRLLTRISGWMTSGETLAWVVGIVGFLVARDAAGRLGLVQLGG